LPDVFEQTADAREFLLGDSGPALDRIKTVLTQAIRNYQCMNHSDSLISSRLWKYPVAYSEGFGEEVLEFDFGNNKKLSTAGSAKLCVKRVTGRRSEGSTNPIMKTTKVCLIAQ
jgi:hypothetical protein